MYKRQPLHIACLFPSSCDSKVEACTDGAEIGYSGDHIPVASEPLDAVYDAALIEGDDLELIGSGTTMDCAVYLGKVFSVLYIASLVRALLTLLVRFW